MKPGAVIVDVAVDQGGCIETTHETTHADPVYEVHGVLHYARRQHARARCRSRRRTRSRTRRCPTRSTLAVHGVAAATAADPALRNGVNTVAGAVTHPIVAEALDEPYVPLEAALGLVAAKRPR